MDHKDPQNGHTEEDRSQNQDPENGHTTKPLWEETSTSRQESAAIDLEYIQEYLKSSKKLKELDMVKWQKETKKGDKKKRSKALYSRNYYIFSVGEDSVPFEYDDPETRNGFVAKVFLIVACLLVVNAFVAAVVRLLPIMREVMEENLIIVAVLGFGALAILTSIHIGICYYSYMSRPPCTWVILFLAFMCYNIILSLSTLYFNSLLILCAIGSTGLVMLICFLLALTKIDFTKCVAVALIMLLAAIAASILVGILAACGVPMKIWQMGTIVFMIVSLSFMLIIQMQMILGGKSVEFGEDDLALPAFMIYTSVITIFLQMLRLLQRIGVFGDSEYFSDD